jgi:hypothetical protein
MLNAMDKGIATTPTVSPATQSFPRDFQPYPFPSLFEKSSKVRGIKSRGDTSLNGIMIGGV